MRPNLSSLLRTREGVVLYNHIDALPEVVRYNAVKGDRLIIDFRWDRFALAAGVVSCGEQHDITYLFSVNLCYQQHDGSGVPYIRCHPGPCHPKMDRQVDGLRERRVRL